MRNWIFFDHPENFANLSTGHLFSSTWADEDQLKVFAAAATAGGMAGAAVFDAPALLGETTLRVREDFCADFAELSFFPLRVFAQRTLWAAAIFARAPALKVRFFACFLGNSAALAFFTADSA